MNLRVTPVSADTILPYALDKAKIAIEGPATLR
jgi:hypothetical protein